MAAAIAVALAIRFGYEETAPLRVKQRTIDASSPTTSDVWITGLSEGPTESFISGVFTGRLRIGRKELIADDADGFVAALDSDLRIVWAEQVGGPDHQTVAGVAASSGGGVTMAGYAMGAPSFATGARVNRHGSAFVGEYLPDRRLAWWAIDDNPSPSSAWGVATGGLRTFVALNRSEHPALLMVVEPTGKPTWSASVNTVGSPIAEAVAATAAGGAVVVGAFEHPIDFVETRLTSAGGLDCLVVKFDPNGRVVWALSFGGTSYDTAAAVTVVGDTIVVVGNSSGLLRFGDQEHPTNPAGSGFVAAIGVDGAPLWLTVPFDLASDLRALDANETEIVAGGGAVHADGPDEEHSPALVRLTSSGARLNHAFPYPAQSGSISGVAMGNEGATIAGQLGPSAPLGEAKDRKAFVRRWSW